MLYAYILGLSFLFTFSNAIQPTVTVGNASVIGTEFRPAKVEFFGGIPFAHPPVGQLRLSSPVLAATIHVPKFDASSFGNACLQNALPVNQVSENCLNLNVYRPSGTKQTDKLPVMVWIYGGGFIMGASSVNLYNGSKIVSRSVSRGTPIIYASINYRGGPLGFPQGIEASQRGILNLGLQDQLAALEWIQANIKNFGGDPTKVTVAGESAGAVSINIHLLGGHIRRLARAAILESTASFPTFGPDRNEAQWQQFVAAVPVCATVNGAHTIDCIRSADSASLLTALTTAGIFGNTSSFGPVIDGPGGLLPSRPSLLMPPQARLPTLIGSNLDEGTLATPQGVISSALIGAVITETSTPSDIVNASVLAKTVQQVQAMYPENPALGSPFGTGNSTFSLNGEFKRFAAIVGDFLFQSSRRTFAQNTSSAGVPVFAYLFTDPDAVVSPDILSTLLSIPPAPGSLGVAHSSEINYVFNNLVNDTPSAQALSLTIQDYWISFVTSMDPNDGRGSKRPNWPQYTSSNQVLLELNGYNTIARPDDFRLDRILLFQNSADALHR